jgi:hypothetical protein
VEAGGDLVEAGGNLVEARGDLVEAGGNLVEVVIATHGALTGNVACLVEGCLPEESGAFPSQVGVADLMDPVWNVGLCRTQP